MIDYQSRIIRDPQICGGQPVIKGTRVTLRTVLASLAEGAGILRFSLTFHPSPRTMCVPSSPLRQLQPRKTFLPLRFRPNCEDQTGRESAVKLSP
jgi:hypothetical protein